MFLTLLVMIVSLSSALHYTTLEGRAPLPPYITYTEPFDAKNIDIWLLFNLVTTKKCNFYMMVKYTPIDELTSLFKINSLFQEGEITADPHVDSITIIAHHGKNREAILKIYRGFLQEINELENDPIIKKCNDPATTEISSTSKMAFLEDFSDSILSFYNALKYYGNVDFDLLDTFSKNEDNLDPVHDNKELSDHPFSADEQQFLDSFLDFNPSYLPSSVSDLYNDPKSFIEGDKAFSEVYNGASFCPTIPKLISLND